MQREGETDYFLKSGLIKLCAARIPPAEAAILNSDPGAVENLVKVGRRGRETGECVMLRQTRDGCGCNLYSEELRAPPLAGRNAKNASLRVCVRANTLLCVYTSGVYVRRKNGKQQEPDLGENLMG